MKASEIIQIQIPSLIGTPYVWGGQSPYTGFDCSGLMVYLLESIDRLRGDYTSQGLYDYFKMNSRPYKCPEFGCLLFFGRDKITHVSMALNEFSMLESGGGGRDFKDRETALKLNKSGKNAGVRVSRISRRKDLKYILKVI